jgi:hypothetical protein
MVRTSTSHPHIWWVCFASVCARKSLRSAGHVAGLVLSVYVAYLWRELWRTRGTSCWSVRRMRTCARSTVWMAVTCTRRWQETNGGWLSICMLPRERAVYAWLYVMTETGEVTLQQTDAKLCERRAELWTLSLRARMVLQV